MIIYNRIPLGFYIYAYIRNKTSVRGLKGTPYYIGKGKGYRAYVDHKNIPVPKDFDYIIIMEENLTELGSLALERRYIRWYGKISDGSGILHNMNDGGTGGSPSLQSRQKMSDAAKNRPTMSQHVRKKLSKSLTGRKLSDEHRNKIKESVCRTLKGPKSWEIRKKMQDAALCRGPTSEETKKKQSDSNKGQYWWTNGVKNIRSHVNPGEHWRRGRTKTCSTLELPPHLWGSGLDSNQ
jgi:hypothetical protein